MWEIISVAAGVIAGLIGVIYGLLKAEIAGVKGEIQRLRERMHTVENLGQAHESLIAVMRKKLDI